MRVVLDLKPGVHPLSGVLTRPGFEPGTAFTGTLELLALLEATVTAGPTTPSHLADDACDATSTRPAPSLETETYGPTTTGGTT